MPSLSRCLSALPFPVACVTRWQYLLSAYLPAQLQMWMCEEGEFSVLCSRFSFYRCLTSWPASFYACWVNSWTVPPVPPSPFARHLNDSAYFCCWRSVGRLGGTATSVGLLLVLPASAVICNFRQMNFWHAFWVEFDVLYSAVNRFGSFSFTSCFCLCFCPYQLQVHSVQLTNCGAVGLLGLLPQTWLLNKP